MGRPKEGEGSSAIARLEAAFFEELRRTPFRGLTISGVVRSAGVNRNSFYYHYADLDDLAHSAVSHLLVSDIPRLIASGFAPSSARFDDLLAGVAASGDLARMLIVTGPNSTSELRDILKEAVIDLWLSTFGIERSDLDERADATVRFILAGALELLANSPVEQTSGEMGANSALDRLAAIRDLPVIETSARLLADVLGTASTQ